MARLVIMGGLGYHNDTILQPIIKYAESVGMTVVWHKFDEDGANVHIPEFTTRTMELWSQFLSVYLQDGDRILISDFWNPMIFPLKFYATRKFEDIKFFAIHHGSSDLVGDFASEDDYASWCSKAETAWASCYEKIFFGSETVQKNFENTHGTINGIVSYLPISYIEDTISKIDVSKIIQRVPNRVIMPLRPDYDKGFDLFLTYANENTDKEFYVSSPLREDLTDLPNNVTFIGQLGRKELFEFEMTCEYVAAFARQETFGYSVLEAILCGCKLISNYSQNTSYVEFYKDTEDIFSKIRECEKIIINEIMVL